MRGDSGLGETCSYQDFGWEVPGDPATSQTLLNGRAYTKGTMTSIAGATVSLSSGQAVVTNATGFYQCSLTPGTFNVTVSADGYTSVMFSVTLATGQTLTRDVELDRTAGAVLKSLLVPILLAIGVIVVAAVLFVSWRRRKREGLQR